MNTSVENGCVHEVLDSLDERDDHIKALQEQIKGHCKRIADQSELLGKRAERRHGLSSYYKILEEMADLHERKARDYGTGEDPLANIRASEEFGVPAWLGAVLRGNDKMKRLKAYAINGTLANEGVEDSLMDLAAYAMIALVLFRETKVEQ